MAWRKGEPWAVQELNDPRALDFYRSFFALPENQQGADVGAIIAALIGA